MRAEPTLGNMTAPIEYEDRILLYVDILGWSRLVADSEHDMSKRQLVGRAIDHIISFHGWARIPGIAATTGWHVALASDSFFASSPVESEYLDNFLLETARLARSLLLEGVFLRGALVQGQLLHNKALILGPAVVRAVELEHAANYPRILVDDRIRDRLSGDVGDPGWIYEADDDRASFDYIRYFCDCANLDAARVVAEVDRLLEAVDRKAGQDEQRQDPQLGKKIAEKNRWVREYLTYHRRVVDPGAVG
jgi:hypothetical protein